MKLTKEIDDNFNNDTQHFCAVMLFDTSLNRGINTIPNNWINYKNHYFTNGTQALSFYLNADAPAKEVVTAKSKDELLFEMLLTIDHFQDDDWKNNNLYPYL